MKIFKKLGLFALAGFLVAGVGNVHAATTGTSVVNVGVTGGALSITAPTVLLDFGNTTLTGNTQTLNATLGGFTAGDATGTGNGWRVTVRASQFTEVGGAAFTLPTDILQMSAPTTVAPTGGTTSAVPSIKTGAPWTIDGASSVTVLSAAVNQGMGNYQVTVPGNTLTLTLNPATTKIDATNFPAAPTPYRSTLTWTVITGP